MTPHTVVHVQDWPAVMDRQTAAAYLGVSDSHFQTILKTYHDRVRAFNLLPNGDTKWSRDTLDAFVKWRESLGVEKHAQSARRAV